MKLMKNIATYPDSEPIRNLYFINHKLRKQLYKRKIFNYGEFIRFYQKIFGIMPLTKIRNNINE